ncbi:CBS domain-containing membrane protein [Marinobacter daqiaonensis]|uniref:CBS domain-containing membrane protein n=1 Tax=Marinobacter daqiaonensis TaxID=650891 RepID=A0A1I6IFG5_9GAMM|nr:HPP family protein [Marinobacter daqiaonensis]SFR65423.1 CBS domain-containing membrane protein [Marinobacter daqiaonensis]
MPDNIRKRAGARLFLRKLLEFTGVGVSGRQSLSSLPLIDRLKIGIAAAISILAVILFSQQFSSTPHWPVLVASMGASAILLFALPNSPLAQPWSFVGGHLLPAAIGVACAQFFPDLAIAAAATVGISLFAMYLFECVHPPGGAAALVPVIAAQDQPLGFDFVFYPVGLNVLVMLAIAIMLNRYWLGKSYPVPPVREEDPAHRHNDPSPMKRLGIRPEDLHHALSEYTSFLDVNEQDLNQLYGMAQSIAYRRRMGEVTCADIMSTDLITVEYGTDLEDAWALLRYHKVKILPVVDRAHRITGVISLVDFLKRANLKTYRTFAEDIEAFLRKSSPFTPTEKPEVVGQIMATEVFSARQSDHIANLVPLLSDKGLHHIPIVDAEDRLVGMVTQSDLIAALYNRELPDDPPARGNVAAAQ